MISARLSFLKKITKNFAAVPEINFLIEELCTVFHLVLEPTKAEEFSKVQKLGNMDFLLEIRNTFPPNYNYFALHYCLTWF